MNLLVLLDASDIVAHVFMAFLAILAILVIIGLVLTAIGTIIYWIFRLFAYIFDGVFDSIDGSREGCTGCLIFIILFFLGLFIL